MKKLRSLAAGLALLATATAGEARASTYSFTFSGPGLGGSLVLTYGTATDSKYPTTGYEITGVSGTFYDTNNGLNITNAAAGSLVAVNYATPEPGNLLAPHDFSRFAVASGLPPDNNGVVTYDNLIWPGGSPQTGSDYPPHGGFLDVYGVMFDIGGGRMVDIWSDGDMGNGVTYGAAVFTANTSLDYVFAGVTTSVTPEPGPLALLGVGAVGLAGVLAWRRRRTATLA
ncbi:hypothetical protein tb265_05930 [Gemmatimonadetes bacterium T265]|nr:hypothetical protein tb265_05930 [Gemmatimonadetes bacterium T265]